MRAKLTIGLAIAVVVVLSLIGDSLATYAFDTDVGPEPTPGAGATGMALKWKVRRENSTYHSLIADAEHRTIYAASDFSVVIAVDPDTGGTKWEFDPNLWGSSGTRPVYGGGLVFRGANRVIFSAYPSSPDHVGAIMFAVDARTGKERWRFEIIEQQITAPVVAGDTLYFGSEGTSETDPSGSIYALRLADGTLKWELPLPGGYVMDAPAISKGILYFTQRAVSEQETSYFRALNMATGEEKWRFPANKGILHAPPPIVSGNKVYFLSDNFGADRLYALYASTGKLAWDYTVADRNDTETMPPTPGPNDPPYFPPEYIPTQSGISTWPVIKGGIVCFGANILDDESNADSEAVPHMVALDAETGREKWRMKLDNELSGGLAIQGGFVYFGTEATGLASPPDALYSVNANNGSLQWKLEVEDAPNTPIVYNGALIYADNFGYLYALLLGPVGMPDAGGQAWPVAIVVLVALMCLVSGLSLRRRHPISRGERHAARRA
jgi:outer membrane protein assembly factor BamB